MADLFGMLQAAAGNAGEDIDPNFNQTVLLLHGDGTNGAQNNTFLDGSTNNFTITRNGNTTQGTFSPFSAPDGRWSNFFDGTGDELTVADNAVFELGSSNFTIEAFIYFTVGLKRNSIVTKLSATATAATSSFGLEVNATDKLSFGLSDNSAYTTIVGSTTLSANTWNHVAAVRNGNTVKIYVNGVEDGSGSFSSTVPDKSIPLGIGGGGDFDGLYFTGYISNVRFVKGTALYTSAFTPSTEPLTTTSQGATSSEVELLTCQSNRFVDNSTNNFAITRNGDVKVTPFSPFAPTAAYDASVNGGSGYFDGTGDFLTVADNAAWDFGSGDFCVETWVYIAGNSATNGGGTKQAWIIGTESNTSPVDDSDGWMVFIQGDASTTGTGITFIRRIGGGSPTNITYTATITKNAWHHIAVTRESSSLRIFFNGSVVASDLSFSGNVNSSGVPLKIATRGTISTFESYLNGYLSNMRVVKGSAVYTSAFTPSTAPVTAITNTQLLTNFTNAGIFDNTGKNNLETVGNAQIDTTTKKYGTGSMEFDGTGDYLVSANGNAYIFGTEDFTLEGWIYLNNVTANQTKIIVSGNPYGGVNNTLGLRVGQSFLGNVNGLNIFRSGQADLEYCSFTFSASTWYHIAVCRTNSTIYFFVDGTQVTTQGSGGATYSFVMPNHVGIGAAGTASAGTAGGEPYNGFIDDFRITKGVARYTANFTPPTKAFPNL